MFCSCKNQSNEILKTLNLKSKDESKIKENYKTLYFDNFKGSSYTFNIKENDSVEIIYKYLNENPSIDEAKFVDGQVTNGIVDRFNIGKGDDGEGVVLSVRNEDYVYFFVKEKSTCELDDLIHKNEFNGQSIRNDEKFIYIKVKKDKMVHINQDMHNEGHYSSEVYTVPKGKKWVLLYARSIYTFENSSVSEILNLSINNNIEDWFRSKNDGSKYHYSKDINIGKAKDENIKFYSGDEIYCFAGREFKGNGTGSDWIDYEGEMCVLETNE